MIRRLLTAAPLLAVIIPALYFGGIFFSLLLGAFVLLASWEYGQLFISRGHRPSMAVLIAGVFALQVSRAPWFSAYWNTALISPIVFTAAALAAMIVHLVDYERGRDEAAVDFVVTLGGLAYLGWVAAYMLDLRGVAQGGQWVMLVFGTVWLSDTFAYVAGSRWGRHKMSPRLSPKKSWEGFIAGIVGGVFSAVALELLFGQLRYAATDLLSAAILGLILGTFTTFGDLGESLLKRYASAKDSGSAFPGHGGGFDRIDSLIWAGVIGYCWVLVFVR